MNRAVFLDRDGVINEYPGRHVTQWSDFKFMPDAIEALKTIHESGYKIIVVTNQSGIARGIYTESDLAEIHSNMLSALESHGIGIDGIYYCPHDESDGCRCRKPETGLLLQAKRDHNIDLSRSFVIGDRARDIIAGKSVGCATVLISQKLVPHDFAPDHTAASFLEAAKLLASQR